MSQSGEVTLQVDGMTCTSCSVTVENILLAKQGVISTIVNLMTNQAKIKYDPGAVGIILYFGL
jgi:Cu+-exporting ATPase